MNFLKLRVDLRIALLYAIFGGVWILLSDHLLAAMVSEPSALTRLQTYKGWVFVAASALVIFLLLRRELRLRAITEGKLDESEERYRQVFEQSLDAILLTSPDGRVHAANPAACRMFGRTEAEIKRLGRDGVVDVNDPRLPAALEERARTGSFHGELTYIRGDGSRFEGEVTTNIFRDANGSELTSMIIRDTTERRHMLEALHRSEERYKLISSLASDYMFYSRVDDGGQLQLEWVAGAFEGITGYAFEEYNANGGWRASVHPDDLEVDDRDMQKLREGRRVITEIRTITKSGGTRWVRVYAQPVLHPESRQLVGIHGAVQEITERKKAEQSLQEAQNHLKIVLNNAPIVLLAVDRNGIFTLSEGAGLIQSGLQPGQVVGMSAYDLYGELSITLPDGQNISGDELLERVFAGETVIASTELNGAHFENRFAPLLDHNGEVNGMVGVSIDVTERKQTEEALRKSEELYRKLTENFPNGTVNIYDRDLRMTFVAGGDLQKYDRQPEEFIGRTFQELAPPETFAIAEPHLRAAFEGKSGYYETPYWEDRHYLVNLAPLREADGTINEILVVTQNMSERKRAEDELQSAQALIEKAFASLSEAILVIDPNGRKVIACNPAIEKIFGYRPEEVIGRSTEFLHVDRDSFEQFGRIGEPVLSDKGLFQTEYRMRRKDGGIILTENSVSTLRDDKGWTSGVVSVVRDITERKRAEEELRLSRDRLAELSRRLAETREAEARAIGRELHDQIGQMLTAMKITLDLAVQQPAEAAAKKIEQAQSLTAELLNRVSRLSLELRPPMLDDLGLLPALAWRVNHYQEETGLEVDFKHSGVEGRRFPPEIETAAYRIVQEALTNVARHAGATRARLEVRERGGWLEIRIEDDGVTFDVESALAKNRGLAGMRERAQLVGGTFQIESEPGRGMRKFIRLPLPGDET